MTDQDKKELRTMMVEVFNQGFEQLIEPRFEVLEKGQEALTERVVTVEKGQQELQKGLARLEEGMDTLNTKFDQQQFMLDNHDRRIETLEKPVQIQHA